MNAMYSLVFVLALVLFAFLGTEILGLQILFGPVFLWIGILTFIIGVTYRIVKWAKSPVPFSIPTTTGQQWSTLPMVEKKHAKWDNPQTGFQTCIRMALEVFAFRSLFRNTKVCLLNGKKGPVVGYASSKFLWVFALMFHYSFLVIIIRHMRLFFEPVPGFVRLAEFLDGIFQISAPNVYLTNALFVVSLAYLIYRRFADAKVNYISLVQDYFPLFLILAIALSGIYMRYVTQADIVGIKAITMGMLGMKFVVREGIQTPFFIHVFLVSVLLMYFPFSKLMHAGGVFLSPTRNLPNNSRAKHYENPWNDPNIKPHSYEAYENDFREPMAEVGLPLDKPLTKEND